MRLDAVGLSLPTIDGKHLEVHSLDFPDGKGQIQPGTLPLPGESSVKSSLGQDMGLRNERYRSLPSATGQRRTV